MKRFSSHVHCFFAFAHLLHVFSEHAHGFLRLRTCSTYFSLQALVSLRSRSCYTFLCACTRFSAFGQLYIRRVSCGLKCFCLCFTCFLPIITIFTQLHLFSTLWSFSLSLIQVYDFILSVSRLFWLFFCACALFLLCPLAPRIFYDWNVLLRLLTTYTYFL